MPRIAVITATSRAIAHTGKGVDLPPGRYGVAELDGAAERGQVYVHGPNGWLTLINRNDPNITIEEQP